MKPRSGTQIRFIASAAFGLLLSVSPGVAAPREPSWFKNPPKENADLVYERGDSEKSDTKQEAAQKAYAAALQRLSNRIAVQITAVIQDKVKETEKSLQSEFSKDVEQYSEHQLIGIEIAEEEASEYRGKWTAWVLISQPRDQFLKAMTRAKETFAARKRLQDRRPGLLVCPVAFGDSSEEQYPQVVAAFKSKGYGNAIWQTIEDKLYDTKRFQIVTPPSKRMKSMLEQVLGAQKEAKESKLPRRILLCNMNFFEIKTESLRLAKVAKALDYHVELMLEYYDLDGPYGNTPVVAKGDAVHKDLLVATDQATVAALAKLLKRIDEAK